ncbi:MAG: hypothetical protein IPH54_16200 [Rhodoferax sp.]|nr:hypothetical protein [Rhodoferax sp.]
MRTSLRSLRPSDNQRAANSEEYLRVLCTGANQLAGDLLRLPNLGTEEERAAARKECVERFVADMAIPLDLNVDGMVNVVRVPRRSGTNWPEYSVSALRKARQAPPQQPRPRHQKNQKKPPRPKSAPSQRQQLPDHPCVWQARHLSS